jgi:flagellar hook protein FlgE
MSLTSAMLVGFTGIQSNQVTVDTVGDNLANSNTTAFKSQRTLFETLMYRTVSEGSASGPTTGGTLPQQMGNGADVAAIQRNFEQGSLEATGFSEDLAIRGRGFFILQDQSGEQFYTRDGSFRIDENATLVSNGGVPLQVFAADADGNIDTSQLTDLLIPLGSTIPPIATSHVTFEGHLDAAGAVASTGAVLSSQSLSAVSGAAATDATSLTDLIDENGVPLFHNGDVLSINAKKGDVSIPQAGFIVGTDGSSLGDLAGFLETILGINTDESIPGDSGVFVENGALVVRSNPGEVNTVEMDGGSIRNTTTTTSPPFLFEQIAEPVGSSEKTSFTVLDSLGNPVEVRMRFVLEERTDAGTTWRYYAESIDDTDLSPILGTGTITFDQNGRFMASANTSLSIDRQGVGSVTPLAFEVDLSSLTGHASPDGASSVRLGEHDGKEEGVLVGYEVAEDGIVTGQYTGEREVVFGQVALATFINDEGLLAAGENVYKVGVNSGQPSVIAPETGAAGSIKSGHLEQSNVELAREFINLITASTGITSASRVVRTADDLLQQLLLLAR